MHLESSTHSGITGQIGKGCTVVHKMSDVGKCMQDSGYSSFYKQAMMQS